MPMLLLNRLKPKEKSMYKVRIEKAAQKALEKINEPYYSKIKIAILNLARNPRPVGYKKLKGRMVLGYVLPTSASSMIFLMTFYKLTLLI